ncbi:hypothetical protein XGA_4696 [Xanthomonas hortorum ATCC 19865]
MHRAPLGKRLGQHPPLATTLEQIEHRAKHLVQIDLAWRGLLACTFKQSADLLKLLTADVTGIACSHLHMIGYFGQTLNRF